MFTGQGRSTKEVKVVTVTGWEGLGRDSSPRSPSLLRQLLQLVVSVVFLAVGVLVLTLVHVVQILERKRRV